MDQQNILLEIDTLEQEFDSKFSSVQTLDAWDQLRIYLFGKNGRVPHLMQEMRHLSPEGKREVGQKINLFKNKAEGLLKESKENFAQRERAAKEFIDYSLPGREKHVGRKHPLVQTLDALTEIFVEIGFQVVEGREIETERYNFTVLNIPFDHPARDGFDTFYTEDGFLLRSQTSTVQGRILEKHKPPLAVIAPGKVYRPDTVDACHSFMFHQMEGFWLDEGIRFSDLKGVLHLFAKKYFGLKTKTRFRPHYFPFTEPSVEMDISCFACQGKGCSVCSRSGWIEILGAGSIHPRVLESTGHDPQKYKGFAFGLGIERICMLKHNIKDIRYFYENNLKFLEQF